MKYTLAALILMGGTVMAQNSGGGGGGGGASTPSPNMNSVRASDGDIRLVLQFAADQGGSFQSYPSQLGDAVWAAANSGLLDDGRSAITPTNSSGGGGGGVTSFALTAKGRERLAALTASAPNPTRMVHGQRFIPGAGVVTYGAAYEAPLSGPVEPKDGTVIDKRR